VIILFFILDRGRIISPAYGRATPQQIGRLRAITDVALPSQAPSQETDGDQREGVGTSGRGGQLSPSHAQRDGAYLQAPDRSGQGDHAVPRAEADHLSPVARHSPHAHDGDRQGEVRRLRSLSTVCPSNCIKLVPGEDEQGNRYPLVFEIDEFRCIFCGYCQEVCPEEAIHVGRHYENSEYSREGFVYDLERLMSQTHPVSEMWDPSDPKGE
jgi:NAD-dependent dihydropyrimidine dehydrogenase PreA subunit